LSGAHIGIDAAITAHHHVCVRQLDLRGVAVTSEFSVPPTLAGLSMLTSRLAEYPGAVAVAEPTSMTWLPLAVALSEAGGQLSLLGSRHAARPRGAISAKNKSDVIDAEVLARAGEVFELTPLRLPEPAQLALRRICVRRGGAVIDANRHLRRLISLARWAFGGCVQAPSLARCPPPRRCWAAGHTWPRWPARAAPR
jgi:transposase